MTLNASQIKSPQRVAHGDVGSLYLIDRDKEVRLWAFGFTAKDGKRTLMEFAAVGDKEGS